MFAERFMRPPVVSLFVIANPSRFQSRFRSEKSHGEGVPKEETGSNGRPQTP